MKEIQQWTAVICLAALTATLAQWPLPPGSMERMGKFIVGAFIVCVMISPISKFVSQANLALSESTGPEKQQSEKFENTVENQVEEESRKSITSLVTAELSRIGMKCKNVQVTMDRNKDGRISITKVIVCLNSKNAADAQKAKEYLEKELQLKTEVVLNGG